MGMGFDYDVCITAVRQFPGDQARQADAVITNADGLKVLLHI